MRMIKNGKVQCFVCDFHVIFIVILAGVAPHVAGVAPHVDCSSPFFSEMQDFCKLYRLFLSLYDVSLASLSCSQHC